MSVEKNRNLMVEQIKRLRGELNEDSTGAKKEIMWYFNRIKIEPVSVDVKESDDETLKFILKMSNGDKIEYESYRSSSPDPMSTSQDSANMKINGKSIKLKSDEQNMGVSGAFEAYKRIKKF